MSEKENDDILLFDTLYTTNHIQILKILLKFFKPEEQKKIAVYIKMKELLYTVENTQKISLYCNRKEQTDTKTTVLPILLKQIKPFCTKDEAAMFEKIVSMQNNFEKYQEMMKMMQLLEPMMGDMNNGGSMDSVLKNFLSEEQMAMFEMFQSTQK